MPADRSLPDPRQALGRQGEDDVARWYESRGYEVVARNWRCRDGELDLVLRRGRILVFCEVKSRTTTRFGAPAEAVTRAKQIRLRRLAGRYLSEAVHHGGEVRFDVAAVLAGEIEIYAGAF